jgi:hypothetical protein
MAQYGYGQPSDAAFAPQPIEPIPMLATEVIRSKKNQHTDVETCNNRD